MLGGGAWSSEVGCQGVAGDGPPSLAYPLPNPTVVATLHPQFFANYLGGSLMVLWTNLVERVLPNHQHISASAATL